MFPLREAFVLPLLLSLSYAFNLQFLKGTSCDGEPAGKFFGTIKTASGCQTSYTGLNNTPVTAPGGGFNVLLQPEGGDKSNTGVAFYGRKDCKLLIGFANVATCLGAGNYQSFKVIKLSQADDELQLNLDPAATQPIPPKAKVTMKAGHNLPEVPDKYTFGTETVMSHGNHPTGTAAKRKMVKAKRDTKKGTPLQGDEPWTPKLKEKRALGERSAVPGQVTHGDTVSSNGKLYRYHQLSRRVFRGVPAETWDEKLHKRNDAGLPLSRNPTSFARHVRRRRDTLTSPNEKNNVLSKREIDEDRCTLIRTCMITQPNNNFLTISSAGDDLIEAIATLNTKNKHDWQYLEHPFAVELVNEAGQSQGYILAQTQIHSDPLYLGGCSGASVDPPMPDERGVLKDVLVQALAAVSADKLGVESLKGGDEATDVRIDIKIPEPGVAATTNTLFVSTRSSSNDNMSFEPICESVEVNY